MPAITPMLSSTEIENWREYLLDDCQEEERRIQINALCDMAIAALAVRKLLWEINEELCDVLNQTPNYDVCERLHKAIEATLG